MRNLVAIIFVLTALAASAGRVDSLTAVLDSVIEQRPFYQAQRQAEISELQRACALATSDEEQFETLGRLYDSYNSYDIDSAYVVGLRREEVARQMHNENFIINAKMNQASALAYRGLFREAMEIMESIDRQSIPGYLTAYYYHINRTIYGHMADYASYAPLRERYLRLTDAYRDSLVDIEAQGTLARAINEADHLNYTGRPAEACDILRDYLESNEIGDHEKAYTAWTLATSYDLLGDTASMKEQLIIASIGDLRSATREYVSLRHLAMQLFREGDLERAYQLLDIAMEDAMASNSRVRILEMSKDYPEINRIYIAKVHSQRRALWCLVGVVSVLLLVVVMMLLRLRNQMKEVERGRKAIADANEALNAANESLKHSNEQLKEANRAISESERVKEAYIGKYMDQCLVYIDRMEHYRKALMKLDAAGNREELRQKLRSNAFVEEELKSFYENFDKTFLNLFPTFVNDFNALLDPAEAIVPKDADSLNTTLRIFALIRLGITDSDRIAKFLGYSVTTIYNYRTRIRNKARGERSRLEEDVMEIGRQK